MVPDTLIPRVPAPGNPARGIESGPAVPGIGDDEVSETLNARTPAEWERWFGVYTALDAMQHVIPVAERRRLADRAVELMRQSEAERHADVVVDAGPTASPVPVAQALGRGPERFVAAGPTDADLRGEVVHGD